ncbi:hypothetical protein OEW28_11200 [Defluviimonas sp. WL0002]|uniref:Uncharacterized protein n=1 Tax=Albidovulum marisflavi TaxID=2984159 RepID=A0ABT2ZDJ7_9RHOB|nr:hypothetical protein [Defluviimonas sp. WL0002]MCV2869194.1 hypothetical protein [Defluviimonas sp. WL0002]
MTTGNGQEPRMILLRINETYWLFEGEEFLSPMLKGSGYFPTPVICYRFEDHLTLRAFIGAGRPMTDFWGINPDIVERLRRDEHLLETEAPLG